MIEGRIDTEQRTASPTSDLDYNFFADAGWNDVYKEEVTNFKRE